jgi:hypothetical protein
MRELDLDAAARALGDAPFNLLKRTAEGGLVLSADRWRFAALTEEAIVFTSVPVPGQPTLPLELRRSEIERITWDQLPKQRWRSQVRFHLRSGDLYTFSGSVNEAAL